MKLSIQTRRLNDDGSLWARCWPVAEEDRATAKAAGFSGYTLTIPAIGDRNMLSLATVTGDFKVVGTKALDNGSVSAQLDGTITAVQFRHTAKLAAGLTIEEA